MRFGQAPASNDRSKPRSTPKLSRHDVQRLAYLRRIQGKITGPEYIALVSPRARH